MKQTAAMALILFGIALSFPVALARSYVAPPGVPWEALIPYVRANIVPELHGEVLEVYVCSGHIDRSVLTPFDNSLSDFTRVLITEGLRTDSPLADAVEATTEQFRARIPALTASERAEYRSLYWQSLSASSEVLPRLEALFRTARAKGRLRCWLCEKDPHYAPEARRLSQ